MYLNKPELQAVCNELLTDLEGILSWKWDRSFQALLSEIPPEDQNKIRSILKQHFNRQYDKKTIRKAPDSFRTIAGQFGDLRSGQILFSSDPEDSVLIFAAWWPWADGKRISIRLASPDPEAKAPKKPGILSRIIDFIID